MEIKLVEKVLGANDLLAGQNRKWLREHRVYMVNVMSSPGSGKTTLLEATLRALAPEFKAGIIVGDITTSNDAQRLARSGAPVVQINTEPFGGDCHLAAQVIRQAAEDLRAPDLDVLIVENVGNLVCPAEFDIGEDDRVVVLSVTEGEDKPVKYPLMFRVCQAAVLSKTDLLPHLDYDLAAARDFIRQVNPPMAVFELSAKTGHGLDAWLNWLKQRARAKTRP